MLDLLKFFAQLLLPTWLASDVVEEVAERGRGGVAARYNDQSRVAAQHRPELLFVVGLLVVIDQGVSDICLVGICLVMNGNAIFQRFRTEANEFPIARCQSWYSSKESEEPGRHLETERIHALVEQFDGPMGLALLKHAKVLAKSQVAHHIE